MNKGISISIFFIVVFLCSLHSFGQHKIKNIYAWFEPVTGGIQAKDDTAKNVYRGNWLIYIESGSKKLKIDHILIQKEVYKVTLRKVESPVILGNNGQSGVFMKKDTVTLVPGTRYTVYHLELQTETEGTFKIINVPSMYSEMMIVIPYTYCRKKKKKFTGTNEVRYLKNQPLS
jgi:hypothetical protein